jgi:UDP-N-acetylglucosamine 4-epimerase
VVNRYPSLLRELPRQQHRWLVTGVAGFIGSALLEQLLTLDQDVVGLDNFLTGHRGNLEDVRRCVTEAQWRRFALREGDIRSLSECQEACRGVDFVLHQAALGSVPRSLENPLLTHDCNLTGHLNMLVAARDARVRRFVYAASSSTYGDNPTLPKQENMTGRPLSPYAVTKYANELYADAFARCYGIETVGLRYFNVFGRRQDPNGPYAAVIPLWFESLVRGTQVRINGDGTTSRDFCYVDNVVQANLLAASSPVSSNQRIFNVAVGERTTLNQLFELIRDHVAARKPAAAGAKPLYQDFRAGDIRHSQADIRLACEELGYQPTFDVKAGLLRSADWYLRGH